MAGPLFGSQSKPRKLRKGMTGKRLAVLGKIEQCATHEKPLRLGGHDGRAARWLAERGYVCMPQDSAYCPARPRPSVYEERS